MHQAGRRTQALVNGIVFQARFNVIQSFSYSLSYLSNLEGVSESASEKIRLMPRKDLCLSLQPPKACRMNNATVIATYWASPRIVPLFFVSDLAIPISFSIELHFFAARFIL